MEEELDKNNGRDMTPKLIKDLGMRFPTEKSKYRYKYGLYKCAYCGKEFETKVSSVKRGTTKSCGCQKINTLGITHGLKSNRFYNTWYKMLSRCTNPKNSSYKNYGGRGITVCEEWLDVRNFVPWCEATHPNITGVSLDRIDNDGAYSPENCRWATKSEQSSNQRTQNNNTSGYTGVSYYPNRNKWVVRLNFNGRKLLQKCYKTLEEAVQARDQYIIDNGLPHKLSTDYNRN